jgi:hypothetical protein
MKAYDPQVEPDPEAWLALDEGERLHLIEAYHTAKRFEIPNLQLHVVTHAVVETQIAEGDATPVREKARRLMAQGLDRHEAIHAIGSVLTAHLRDLSMGRIKDADPNRRYYSALKRLSAADWLRKPKNSR